MQENDIVFFNLHRQYLNYKPVYGGFIGVYLLAAFMNKNGYSSQAYEGQLVQGKELIDELCQSHKVSMIGLYCDYENVTENIFLSKYIKQTYGLPVIVGGPQATALKEDFYTKSLCDAVVRFEGELTVLELVDCFLDESIDLADIKGISYWDGTEIATTEDRPVIENLDMLPFPTIDDYLDPKKYGYTLGIMTGRGCPFHCAFCHEGHHTKSVRFRSVENVMAELDYYISLFPRKRRIYITFVDDTFTLKPERVKALCNALKERAVGREIIWFCEGHIHTMYKNPEMVDYIADAGCTRIQLGIEAGTQKVLDAYRKNSTPEEIKTVVRLCRDAGINEIYSNIIIGGAHFTREIYEQDVAFAKELIEMGQGAVEIGLVSYWPLAETSITDNPEEYGIKVIDGEFITAVGDFPQIESGGLSRLEILGLQQEFQDEIFKVMEKMLREGAVPRHRLIGWVDKSNYQTGLWKRLVETKKALYNFLSLLRDGEALTSDDFESGDLLSMHPLRVTSLCDDMRVNEEGHGVFFGHTIDKGLMMETLIYCTGKLSVEEIIARLKALPEYMAMSVAHIEENVCKYLQYFEDRHLIVYSKF